MSVRQAINDLRLCGNAGKLAALDAVGDEFMWVVGCYARHIVGLATHPTGWGQPAAGRHAYHPKQPRLPPLRTRLSERWNRCAWIRAIQFSS